MWTAKASICFGSTHPVNSCDHEHCYTTLDHGTDQRCQALCEKDGSRCDVQIVAEFHVCHESVMSG